MNQKSRRIGLFNEDDEDLFQEFLGGGSSVDDDGDGDHSLVNDRQLGTSQPISVDGGGEYGGGRPEVQKIRRKPSKPFPTGGGTVLRLSSDHSQIGTVLTPFRDRSRTRLQKGERDRLS